jgi:hypothetical protein
MCSARPASTSTALPTPQTAGHAAASGACGPQLPCRQLQSSDRPVDVELAALEQLRGHQARARVAARVVVAVRAGQHAGEHLAGVGAHEDHERALGIIGGALVEDLGQEEPRACGGRHRATAIAVPVANRIPDTARSRACRLRGVRKGRYGAATMTEAHSGEVEKVLLYIGDARQRGGGARDSRQCR